MNTGTEQLFLLNSEQAQASSSSPKLIEIPGTSSVNLENVEDFSNVCRTCATNTGLVVPIFAGEGLQNHLADKIHKHLPIKVSETDELPLVVCYQCVSTLLAWHELVKCCVQADQALRSRITVITRENTKASQSTVLASSSNIEDDSQSKFNNTKYTVHATAPQPSRDPPRYTPPLLRCEFCNTTHTEANYSKHLIDEHSELIFHCEDCNRYIHKREFMSHMSQHADNYMRDIEIKYKKKTKLENGHQNIDNSASTTGQQNTGTNGLLMNITSSATTNRNNNWAPATRSRHMYPPAKRSQNTSTTRNQHINLSEEETPKADATSPSSKIIKNSQENEFSDHSDMEYGFGPLPESVFEAIEDTDTQDSQIEDTCQQADTEDLIEADDTTPTNEQNEFKQPQPKKIRTCPICSKVYKASSSYFYHLKHTHKKIKEHECEICAKKFATKASLASHTTTHTGECQFECKQCNKRFRSNASLYIHEQTHTGIKTWSCKQCQTSFRWKTHLLRHMKRHLAEKSHTCSTCGRGFNIRCDLLRHARTHTAGEYPCDKCDVKFAQIRYLKVHMAKKHSPKTRRKSKS